jgi:ssDNA-binding Zn-finger/Zn-ribbon topoisomerase 1
MAICRDCGKEMKKAKTCTKNVLLITSKSGELEHYKRNSVYFDVNEKCHDCGIENKKGNYHHYGCDMERCPKCGGQLISCGCFEGKEVSVIEIKNFEE